jgi:hypothetical protein
MHAFARALLNDIGVIVSTAEYQNRIRVGSRNQIRNVGKVEVGREVIAAAIAIEKRSIGLGNTNELNVASVQQPSGGDKRAAVQKAGYVSVRESGNTDA